jgi:predicted amidohydrolase YtcJ
VYTACVTEHPADLILTGGDVRTMSPAQPRAEALAIGGGRVLAVGGADDVGALAGPDTRVVDLHGRTATPGLVDAHAHLYALGMLLDMLNLGGLQSAAEVAEEVGRAARALPPGAWVAGHGWDQTTWLPPQFPDARPLDEAAPRHPVALARVDGHALWVNTAALRAAGIDRATPDPRGGRIVRDAAGWPTGVLVDRAMALVERVMPPDPLPVRTRRLERAAAVAVAQGLTGVHEMGIDDETITAYRALAAEGKLPLRVHAYLQGEERIDALAGRAPDRDPGGTARFVLGGVKLLADGALGSRGAALLADYADDPGNRGLQLLSRAELEHAARACMASGFQLAVHAIGDATNRDLLDAFAAAGVAPDRDLRFRAEHAQVLAPTDLGRFAALGLVASMQPTHATSDMRWAAARLGPERARLAYACGSVLRTGAHVAFGSDFPVELPSPLYGLHAAVTRQDRQGRPAGGYLPEERITLDEALRAFTVEPAWAAFAEAHRGVLQPGRVADVTVFDRALAPDRGLLATRVDCTIVGGAIVYERR